MERSLEKLLIMIVPTFVDLQGFIVGKRFVLKEVAVLKKGSVLSHYIFASPLPWNLLRKFEKSCFLVGIEDDDALIFVKGYQKLMWLKDMLESDARDTTIETLDADYEDIESLNNLDVINTIRCDKHVKNCALQNVFKIFNWWSQCQKEIFKK